MRGEDAIKATRDYIKNTVGKTGHRVTSNNAIRIEVLENHAQEEALIMHYQKAWRTARIQANEVYQKGDDYYKIAQKNAIPKAMP